MCTGKSDQDNLLLKYWQLALKPWTPHYSKSKSHFACYQVALVLGGAGIEIKHSLPGGVFLNKMFYVVFLSMLPQAGKK